MTAMIDNNKQEGGTMNITETKEKLQRLGYDVRKGAYGYIADRRGSHLILIFARVAGNRGKKLLRIFSVMTPLFNGNRELVPAYLVKACKQCEELSKHFRSVPIIEAGKSSYYYINGHLYKEQM